MRSETKQRIAGVLKFAWYLCASVLILSLPTFSYLLPRQTASGSPATVSRPLEDRSAAGAAGERSGGTFSSFVRGALASLTGEADTPSGTRSAAGEDSRDSLREESAAVASTSRWLPPERFEQRRSRLGPPVVQGQEESNAGPLEPGLTDLEQGYEEAFNSLFPEVFFGVPVIGNPFERALGGDSGASGGTGDSAGGGSNGGTTPPGEGASNPPPGNSGNTPPGGEGSPPGGSGSPEVVEPPGSKEPAFNFLIVGDFSGASGPQLSRARLQIDGQFVLENSFSFSFFPGILHSLLTFRESEKVIIDDLDGDGSLDFVVATEVPAVGTAIESYVQRSPGQFQLSGSAFLYLQEIRSFALFDFNRDGVDELALALAGHPNLVVYERVGSDWLYLRELSLPFRPALVMSAPVAVGVRARSLYVLDERLEFVLSSTDRQPETFRPGSSLPLNHLRRIQINLSGRPDDAGEVTVFSLPGRLILCEGRGGSPRSFASFRMGDGAPLVIIGDYTRTGTRQMLWVP